MGSRAVYQMRSERKKGHRRAGIDQRPAGGASGWLWPVLGEERSDVATGRRSPKRSPGTPDPAPHHDVSLTPRKGGASIHGWPGRFSGYALSRRESEAEAAETRGGTEGRATYRVSTSPPAS
jgi:hypothetical protein